MAISINGTSGISGVDGSAATPAIQGTDTNTGISFGTDEVNINTGGTAAVTVDSSQRVGIGTTAPQVELDVNGRIRLARDNYLQSSDGAGGWVELIKADTSNNTVIRNNKNTAIILDMSGNEAARIDSSRRLLVGTSTAFSGYGMGGVTAGIANYGEGLVCVANGNSGVTGRNLDLIKTGTATGNLANFFYNGTTVVGSISITSTATSFNTSSDYRLKENVVSLTGAADRLKQLPVRRFNFITDPGKTVDGFLAHEAQSVVPECVTGTKDEVDENGDPVYQGIDQSKLVPLLTAALQEAVAKIETLETRLAALEGGTN